MSPMEPAGQTPSGADDSVDSVDRVRPRPYMGMRGVQATMLPAARFQIGELLGRGMHTEVYAAQDRLLRRSVAVKVFPVNPDPVACRRIADEARALDRLRHRGLVSVFDGGLHRSRPYLVMQLVRGPSLHWRDRFLLLGRVAEVVVAQHLPRRRQRFRQHRELDARRRRSTHSSPDQRQHRAVDDRGLIETTQLAHPAREGRDRRWRHQPAHRPQPGRMRGAQQVVRTPW